MNSHLSLHNYILNKLLPVLRLGMSFKKDILMSNFQSLNLISPILESIKNLGYTKTTPIQAASIPKLLDGRDLLGIAQTGTGKTASFSLPILQRLHLSNQKAKSKHIRSLIITPTRELASQINQSLIKYGSNLNLKSDVVFGGVSIEPQIKKLSKGLDILVATPGRLIDLMVNGHIKLNQVEILVLDEADRMLDMGFINDIKRIIKVVPKTKQTVFLSATMPKDILNLANSLLVKPVKIEITPEQKTVEKIDQKLNWVKNSNKPLLLKNILTNTDITSALIFTRTKRGANHVVEHLEKSSISSSAIHGNKSQNAREKALQSFKEGKVKVLVATDIAARGIDIPHVSHVINYNLPEDPENYVHRIGRTARAGRKGVSISFCDQNEIKLLQSIEKFIKQTVPLDEEQPYHEVLSLLTKDQKTSKTSNTSKKNFKFKKRKNSNHKFKY